ncbi:hypothetical protein C8J57DRAFT_1241935 [Mycena rebaudengoi]|nr:hypothetical protein C8J57DRAFT_1241935 [Mycena rebaudengoi]
MWARCLRREPPACTNSVCDWTSAPTARVPDSARNPRFPHRCEQCRKRKRERDCDGVQIAEQGGGLAGWQVRGDGGSILQSYGLREKELGRQHARGKWHVPVRKAMQRGTVSEREPNGKSGRERKGAIESGQPVSNRRAAGRLEGKRKEEVIVGKGNANHSCTKDGNIRRQRFQEVRTRGKDIRLGRGLVGEEILRTQIKAASSRALAAPKMVVESRKVTMVTLRDTVPACPTAHPT